MGAALSTGSDASSVQSTASPHQLSVALRRKLGRGATYIVKVLLRGDAMTGKTSLLRRLQGLRPTPEYAPTRELGVAHVDWASDTEDTVKLEVWDVVDRAKGPASPSLALEHHGPPGAAAPAADAESVDVVRGAHAVVFLIDRRKRWTFEYVERALAQLPDALPVAFVVNFADALRTMTRTGGEAPVEWDEVVALADSERSKRPCVCLRASMVDCHGLDVLHSFLELPYCHAKREALARAQADVAARMQRGHAAVLERARAQQPHAAQPRPPEPPSTPPSAGGAAPPATPPSVGTVESRHAAVAARGGRRARAEQPAADCATAARGAVARARERRRRRRCTGLAPGIDEGFFDDDDAAAAGGVGGAESGAGG